MQLVITDSELQAIDAWRFANRIPSKSEAVRRLAQLALGVQDPASRLPAAINRLLEILDAHLQRERSLIERMEAGDHDLVGFAENAENTVSTLFEHLPQFSNDALAVSEQVRIAAVPNSFEQVSEQSRAAIAASTEAFFQLAAAKAKMS